MASRRRRRGPQGPRPLGGVSGPEQVVERDGLVYRMRQVPGQSAAKPYVCPWCGDTIAQAEPHVVVWPADVGVRERRHWHTRCWRRSG